MHEAQIEPTPLAELDEGLRTLKEHAAEWANLPIQQRAGLTKELVGRADRYASRWAETAAAGKRLPPDSVWVAEEWVSGPWAFIEWCQAATETLTALANGKRVPLPAVRALRDGRAAVKVFPASTWDALLLNGVEAEVRMEPGVTPANLHDHVAAFYRETGEKPGKVCVVLGAGNITSIAPLDVTYRMFVLGQVVMLKMNPVNEWVGPVLEDVFAPLIERGWLRICYGGIEVGSHLTAHELVDELHLTGSEQTYEAIVFGPGEAGEDRKAAGEKLNERPITAELRASSYPGESGRRPICASRPRTSSRRSFTTAGTIAWRRRCWFYRNSGSTVTRCCPRLRPCCANFLHESRGTPGRTSGRRARSSDTTSIVRSRTATCRERCCWTSAPTTTTSRFARSSSALCSP